MKKRIVISQPMFFPWVGLFEQVRLADIYVHYDDIQFPQGRSFISRVQIKTQEGGVNWLTIPVQRGAQLINRVLIDDSQNWREKHLRTLQHSYAKAPFAKEMLEVVRSVYQARTNYLSELNGLAIETVANYFSLRPMFLKSSEYPVQGSSSDRLLELILRLGGSIYITGHGARNYLDHDLLERHEIRVEYLNYRKVPYKQLHGEFTPYVSILDLIANEGQAGGSVIASDAIYWKDFIN